VNPGCLVEETFLLKSEVSSVLSKTLVISLVGLDHIVNSRLCNLLENYEKSTIELKLTFEQTGTTEEGTFFIFASLLSVFLLSLLLVDLGLEVLRELDDGLRVCLVDEADEAGSSVGGRVV